MEFIAELVLEIIMGLFVEIPMESENVKTWVKTSIFLVLCGVMDVLAGFLFYKVCFVNHDVLGSVVLGAILLFLLWATIYGAITGHKRGWKQE